MKLSLIIPAYNEEKIIKNTLEEVSGYLKKKKYSWEVLVVDDGSSDSTSKIVRNSSKKEKRVKLIQLPKNSGKGAALRKGFLASKASYQIYSDADLSVDIKNIDIFLKELKNSDVVIASRRVDGAIISKHQPWHRETMGRFYTFLTQFVVGAHDIKDFTCGFKGFRSEASKKIFSNAKVDRWAYDSEVLFLAKKFDFSISQLPIVWNNREETRVELKSVILESFKDLLQVRVNDALNRYNK